ncbi:MAG TPA: hypothetical protein VGQ46_14055 [Thermoanaerobaculia bacterium]|nr:hypothetical protein [Thermoanaerobaculia bacterium]
MTCAIVGQPLRFARVVVLIDRAHGVHLPPRLEHVAHAALRQRLGGDDFEVALFPQDGRAGKLGGGERLRRARRPRFRNARQQNEPPAIALADAVGAVCLHPAIVVAGALLAARSA